MDRVQDNQSDKTISHNNDSWERTMRYIAERKQLEQTLGYLVEVSKVLVDTADCSVTHPQIVRLSVPYFADWCAIYTGDDQEEVIPASYSDIAYPADSTIANWVRENVVLIARQSPEPQVIFEGTDEVEQVPRGNCALVAPIRGYGRAYGAFAAVRKTGSALFGGADIAIAKELCRRLASSMEIQRIHAYGARME